jgi:hypothetical protein
MQRWDAGGLGSAALFGTGDGEATTLLAHLEWAVQANPHAPSVVGVGAVYNWLGWTILRCLRTSG